MPTTPLAKGVWEGGYNVSKTSVDDNVWPLAVDWVSYGNATMLT